MSGLNYNDNCLDFVLTPGDDRVGVSVSPPVSEGFFTLVNLARVDEENDGVSVERTQNANVYAAVGGVGERYTDELPVLDPGAFFASAMQAGLESRGLTFREAPVRSDGPADTSGLEKLATFGTPIAAVLLRVNSDSQNLFAEALARLIGEEPTWEAGEAAAKSFLAEVGIDPTDLAMADGSGLSRDNRATVRQLTDLLRVMDGHEARDLWLDSLSVAGGRGTLRGRMKDLPGGFIGKTGYIGGVRALSGYATGVDGRRFVVSVLYNRIPGSVGPYTALQDDAVRYVLENAPTRDDAG